MYYLPLGHNIAGWNVPSPFFRSVLKAYLKYENEIQKAIVRLWICRRSCTYILTQVGGILFLILKLCFALDTTKRFAFRNRVDTKQMGMGKVDNSLIWYIKLRHTICSFHSAAENILVSWRYFIMQCKRCVQTVAKDLGNSYYTIDVEKVYKGTMAIISTCWTCFELVSGKIIFLYVKTNIVVCTPRHLGLLIFIVIVLLSHMRYTNGTKNSISKRQSLEIGTFTWRYSFIGIGQNRGYVVDMVFFK